MAKDPARNEREILNRRKRQLERQEARLNARWRQYFDESWAAYLRELGEIEAADAANPNVVYLADRR